ncbi:MAG: 16S rRNA (uracil(1498)-N(3))-methyltransferase [Chloroflexota bacterium]|nr:16S rRNA (uracil(1498)-N(3))-methyltransferase [Chloroflexota bacterium]
MHRFFVSPEQLQEEHLILGGDLAHQLCRVLRMHPGDRIVLLDNSGRAYVAELDRATPSQCHAHIVSMSRPRTEPHTRIVLYQAVPKTQNFDWVLQKGTEIGIEAFVPLLTQRCMIQNIERITKHKMERWRHIIKEAAEQSGRVRLPRLMQAKTFPQACQTPPPGTLALMFSLEEKNTLSLRQVLEDNITSKPEEVWLYVGPEGGFTPHEMQQGKKTGLKIVSLGPRTLRTETAPLVASSIILYALGEME